MCKNKNFPLKKEENKKKVCIISLKIFFWSVRLQNKGYSADWLYELKQKNNIVSIISKYVRLEKKGSKFWGCCPFHNEKTPSFTVDENEGLFYCFGCKESGDVISFVQKYESCAFYDAVKILAKNAGMEVPEYSGDKEIIEKKKTRERTLNLLDESYKFYMQSLYKPDAKPAQEYIKKRGFTRRELEDFKIGYSKDWTSLVNHLEQLGFTYEEMKEGGSIAYKNDKCYDVLAQRLVFPIFNSMNECVGFSARALVPTTMGKYINTAETQVFKKGRVVFAINLVKQLKQSQGLENIIIVEGQIDVIAMHRAGFKNTVACMGTALTQENVRELKKLTNNIVLCFDGDSAGTKATIRSIEILRQEGVNTTIVSLPEGKDPDEVLKTYGKDYLQNLINNALPVTDYLIEQEKKNYDLNSAEEKGKFANAVLVHINKLHSGAEKEPYLEKLRDITSIPIDILRRDEEKIDFEPVKAKEETKVEENGLIARENGNIRAIKFVLASLIHQKNYVDEKIDYIKLLPRYKEIIEKAGEKIKLSSYYDYFDVDNLPLLKDCINLDFSGYEESGKKYFDECLWAIVNQELVKEKDDLAEEFKTVSSQEKRLEIVKKISDITKAIKDKNMEEFYVRK